MERPILDRRPSFDPQSRNFPVRALIRETAPVRRKRMWTTRPVPLDQGAIGACVGFSWSHELACKPVAREVSDRTALALYERARVQDQAMGNHWPEGASVLAGAKACKAEGLISKYHWAFGIDDLVLALANRGPAVLGINWYDNMFRPDRNGLITVGGGFAGGHAILARGVWPNHPKIGADVIALQNSWGPDYGQKGTVFIRVDELGRLLSEGGEACVPTDVQPDPSPFDEPGPALA